MTDDWVPPARSPKDVPDEHPPPTLAEFLLARLDETEQVAKASIALHAEAGVDESAWEVDELGPDDREPYEVVIYPERGGSVTVARTWRTEYGRTDAEHIALHDPARVLADVAAHRRIVELCRDKMRPPEQREGLDLTWDAEHDLGLATLRLLALPYAAHEGYRSEWAP